MKLSMSKTLEFKAFCFEAYRAEKKLTGKETMMLFKQYGVLDYLGACYVCFILPEEPIS